MPSSYFFSSSSKPVPCFIIGLVEACWHYSGPTLLHLLSGLFRCLVWNERKPVQDAEPQSVRVAVHKRMCSFYSQSSGIPEWGKGLSWKHALAWIIHSACTWHCHVGFACGGRIGLCILLSPAVEILPAGEMLDTQPSQRVPEAPSVVSEKWYPVNSFPSWWMVEWGRLVSCLDMGVLNNAWHVFPAFYKVLQPGISTRTPSLQMGSTGKHLQSPRKC